MTRARVAVLVSTALALVVVVVDRRSILGALIVLVFLAGAPGFALVRLVRLPADTVAATVIAIGVSFSIDALVTEAMVYAHVWNPARGVIVLCVLVVALVAAEYVYARSASAKRGEPAQ